MASSNRRRSAEACVAEHLEYFDVVCRHGGATPEYRQIVADRIVAAVTGILTPAHVKPVAVVTGLGGKVCGGINAH